MTTGAQESHAVYSAIRESLGHLPRETAFPNVTPAYGPLDKQYVERTNVPPGCHPHWTQYYGPSDWANNAEIYRLNSIHADVSLALWNAVVSRAVVVWHCETVWGWGRASQFETMRLFIANSIWSSKSAVQLIFSPLPGCPRSLLTTQHTARTILLAASLKHAM